MFTYFLIVYPFHLRDLQYSIGILFESMKANYLGKQPFLDENNILGQQFDLVKLSSMQ